MEELVRLSDQSINGVPYTTADALANYVGINHRSVNKLISNNIQGLEFFGILRFENAKINKGRGRTSKIYQLNEEQATYLMTLFKNTSKVKFLKRTLVAGFYELRNQQIKRQMIHDFSKDISKDLNQAIKNNVADAKGYTYSNFNKLIYKSSLGINTSQLVKIRCIPHNAEITTFLTTEEFKKVNQCKLKVVDLLNHGNTYQEIKNYLSCTSNLIAMNG